MAKTLIGNIKGPQGEQGPAGQSYVLTDTDKEDIANIVINSLPVAEEVEF